ncbi:hypothetical protein GOP47_0024190 [Adiantum capillus-veneris]|uniref:Uncharacterized protein n=1 Tax=Adiantum capillus-veneris TaxID=13818 RepID=A0A9D4U5F5_ADICA|nr:hypothetical protein GOP47_0024190 [Adiantum capillus-veneris]
MRREELSRSRGIDLANSMEECHKRNEADAHAKDEGGIHLEAGGIISVESQHVGAAGVAIADCSATSTASSHPSPACPNGSSWSWCRHGGLLTRMECGRLLMIKQFHKS